MSTDRKHSGWRKSSASYDGNCVEVAVSAGSVLVRHTKDRDGGTLAFTVGEWEAFLQGVANGEFTLEALLRPPPA
jgi:hypothetical protein